MAGTLLAAGLTAPPQRRDPTGPWTLIVSGDTDGYLSPCGCTKPMTGGVRRMAAAVRSLARRGPSVLIDTGDFAAAPGVQSDYKAEATAEILGSLDVAAVNLTAHDVRLGASALASLMQLLPNRFVSGNLTSTLPARVAPFQECGPFLIGGISSGKTSEATFADPVIAVRQLLDTARARHKFSVLMVDGPRPVDGRFAGVDAVVYRRGGWPPDAMEHIGSTALLTPGEQGKAVISVSLVGKHLVGYTVTRLGPEIADDPAASRFYRTYLRRVDSAGLLDALPRSPSDPFAGSAACARCHADSYRIWAHSGHANAYQTLTGEGHGRDPDCVSCHVVGLAYEGGFRSAVASPGLAAVGCESCHGPAAGHIANPKFAKLSHLSKRICETCHTSEQSPKFSFEAYWAKIAH